jgi:hypothetical protein
MTAVRPFIAFALATALLVPLAMRAGYQLGRLIFP